MRTAVISDIHSNLEALEAVLEDIEKRGIDRIICLGDIIGYGADPEACLDLVIKYCDLILEGNHEEMVLCELYDPSVVPHVSAKWTAQRLQPIQDGFFLIRWLLNWWHSKETHLEFLKSLRPIHQENGVLYVHASPRDMLTEYLSKGDVEAFLSKFYLDDTLGLYQGLSKRAEIKLDRNFGRLPGRLCYNGHNHIPAILRKPDNPETELTTTSEEPVRYNFVLPKDLKDGIYQLRDDEKLIVNVGAVGQPRNCDPSASYFIHDDKAKTLECRRVKYDYETTARKIIAAGLSKEDAQRLSEGI